MAVRRARRSNQANPHENEVWSFEPDSGAFVFGPGGVVKKGRAGRGVHFMIPAHLPDREQNKYLLKWRC